MKYLIAFCFLCLATWADAQDLILKKSSDTIHCKVTEIGADEIKYYYENSPKLIFGIDKALVDRIVFGTGEEIVIEKDSFKNPEYYAGQSKNAVKANFLAPLLGYTELAYERSMKPGRSFEAALGIIGLGVDNADINPAGFFTKFALKFTRTPDFYSNRMHYSHILKGAYFAPEIAFRYVRFDDYTYEYYEVYPYESSTVERSSNISTVILIKLGKQWIIEDAFLIDLYLGLGYGLGGDDYNGLPYGYVLGPPESPIAATAGFRVGWVFGQ